MLTFKQALWLQLIVIELLLTGIFSLVALDNKLVAIVWLTPIVLTLITSTLAQQQAQQQKQQIIAQTKRAEADLLAAANASLSLEKQQAEVFHQTILKALEQIPEGVLIYQQETLFFANPAAMAIFKVNQLEALKIEQYFPSDLQKNLQHSRQTGAPFLSAPYNIIDNQLKVKQVRVRASTDKELCFIFIEPLPAPAPISSIATPDKPGLAGKHILIVEDSLANQMLMKGQLEQQGMMVDCADDGEQGVKLARQKAYDIILMDLQMPVMDGISAALQIKNLPQHAMTAIIAMSGSRDEATDKKIQQAGIQGFIQKPIAKDKLVAQLTQHLSSDHPSASTTTEHYLLFDQGVFAQMQQDIGKQRANDMSHVALAEIEKRLTNLELGADKSSLLDMKRQAHTIKSTAASFGLMSLSSLCHLIELQCRDGKTQDIEAQIAQAREVFNSSKVLLASQIENNGQDETC